MIDAFVFAYMEGSEEKVGDDAKTQAKAMRESFRTLSGGDHIVDQQTFVEFVKELDNSPRMHKLVDYSATM